MPAGLELTGVTAGYDDLVAIHDVSLSVSAGAVVGLVGPNGAGKTSTLRAICGVIPLIRGTVSCDGRELKRGSRVHRWANNGIRLVPEGKRLFGSLTVKENLDLGAFRERNRKVRDARLEEVMELFPSLRSRLSQRAGTMSGGQQQMVAIGRALMGQPRFLLIDEPSVGLAPQVVDAIYDTLPTLSARGLGVLVVEQELERLLDVANEIIVLRDGVTVKRGSVGEFRGGQEEFAELYFGSGVA